MAPAYILQTMCGLVKGAFAHSKGDYGFDVIELLMGFEQADGIMQVRRCCTVLASKNCSKTLITKCSDFGNQVYQVMFHL